MKGYHRLQCKQYAHIYLLVKFPSYVSMLCNLQIGTGNQYVNNIKYLWIFYFSPKEAWFEKQLYLQSVTFTSLLTDGLIDWMNGLKRNFHHQPAISWLLIIVGSECRNTLVRTTHHGWNTDKDWQERPLVKPKYHLL